MQNLCGSCVHYCEQCQYPVANPDNCQMCVKKEGVDTDDAPKEMVVKDVDELRHDKPFAKFAKTEYTPKEIWKLNEKY